MAISEGVTVIDFSGPWEFFQDLHIPERGAMEDQMPFDLFTVLESTSPLRGSAGLRLARAGLLAGLEATTHHDFTDRLASQFPT